MNNLFSNFALRLPYQNRAKQFRILWHQTLGEILRYPELPRRCLNFDVYPMLRVRVNTQTTLSSTVLTRHDKAIEDTIITEIWLADNLSMRAGFFNALWYFWQNPQTAGNYLIWYPKDKTEKAFCIDIIKLYIGEESEQNNNPVHDASQLDYRWLSNEVKFVFKITKVFDVPEAVTYLEGA